MIEYIGKKHLNSNFYSRISLKQLDGFIKMTAILDKRLKNGETIELSTPVITEQINTLAEEDKIKEIVLYFLRNNKICEVKQDSNSIIVLGQNGRKLDLQLDEEYQYLIKYIMDKYANDRLEYVYNNNENIVVREYDISNTLNIIHGTSSYYEYTDEIEEKRTLVLTLLEENGKIAHFEKDFIIDYIKYLINETSSHILCKRDKYGITIFINSRSIKLPNELASEVNVLVFNRNIEMDNQKGKQLKLEDYYGQK